MLGRHKHVDRLARAAVVVVPTVVLGELHAGFRIGRRTDENLRVLEQLLGEPFVQIAPITAEVAQTYGRIFAELRRRDTLGHRAVLACAELEAEER